MKIGYARTSTTDQHAGLDAQLRDLTNAGVEKMFSEQVSSVAKREQLEAAIDFAREGDTLIVTKLDRLARSIPDFVRISGLLETKKVTLKILTLDLDTSSPTGKLMLNLLGSIAQFERELMLERQREGIAKAKGEGKYKGRVPTARNRASEVLALREQGKTIQQIVEATGISRASVVRIMRG